MCSWIYILVGFLALGSFYETCLSSRVLELTDRFTEIRKDGGLWLVKFYAPWCGHCKKLEPIWMHVAQALTRSNIKVGRLDVTRFSNVATEFRAYATPTIKFINSVNEHTYAGERTYEAILNYALRMAGSPVKEIRQAESLNNLKSQNQLFFLYIGNKEGLLWDAYYRIAGTLQPYVYFYSICEELQKDEIPISRIPSVVVHKEGEYFIYQDTLNNMDYLNTTLNKWINKERFETFPKISSENIKDIMQTGKFIVLAIIEENKIKHISSDMLEFRNKVELIIRKKRHIYHRHFQFGWMGNADLGNSLTMTRLSLPYLIVLNSSTFQYHIPEEVPSEMTIEAMEVFFEQIVNKSSPVYGGNSLHINMGRKLFDFKRSVEDMWKGNPILLMVLLTLPSLFFLLIMWACCCADLLDADDEVENEEMYHEKNE